MKSIDKEYDFVDLRETACAKKLMNFFVETVRSLNKNFD